MPTKACFRHNNYETVEIDELENLITEEKMEKKVTSMKPVANAVRFSSQIQR